MEAEGCGDCEGTAATLQTAPSRFLARDSRRLATSIADQKVELGAQPASPRESKPRSQDCASDGRRHHGCHSGPLNSQPANSHPAPQRCRISNSSSKSTTWSARPIRVASLAAPFGCRREAFAGAVCAQRLPCGSISGSAQGVSTALMEASAPLARVGARHSLSWCCPSLCRGHQS